MMNTIKAVFGRVLIMKEMWRYKKESGLNKSEALKQAYDFYLGTVFANLRNRGR